MKFFSPEFGFFFSTIFIMAMLLYSYSKSIVMKKIFFSAIIVCLAGAATAQTTPAKKLVESSGKNHTKISKKSTSSHAAKTSKKSTGRVIATSSQTSSVPDNRKEYVQNGQLATYTGHQATPTNTDEFVGMKKKPAKKTKGRQ